MLFSTAGTPEFGVQKLWLIDDATGTTHVLREFPEGIGPMVLAGGKALFLADDGTGQALWTSDGTVAGTHVVKFISLPSTSELRDVTAAQDLVYFQFEDDGVITQWRSDGTEEGTVPIADLTNVMGFGGGRSLDPVGRSVFFDATDGYSGLEPWAIDGAVPGLRLVKDINTSPLEPPFAPRISRDTGRSAWDGVTSDNTPAFDVGSDSVARFCVLYIDGVEVARDTSGFGSFWFDDLPPLADGSYVVTAAVAGADGVFTAPSEPLNIVIDTVAPALQSARFSYNAQGRPQISFQFSEDIFHNNPSLWLRVVDLGTGQQLALSIDQITRDAATHTVTFTLRSFPSGLPRGRYRATLIYSRAEDLAGNVLTGDVFFDFVTRPAVAPLRPRPVLSIGSPAGFPGDKRGTLLLDLLREL
jgi:ELWxxDGT repeat protein